MQRNHRKVSLLDSPLATTIGPMGVYAYIAGYMLPIERDIPLVLLAVMSVLASWLSVKKRQAKRVPFTLPILIFLGTISLSLFVSTDIWRSIHLSAPLLPALLIFFMIAESFSGPQDVRRLYVMFSLAGLGLASLLLWTAWQSRAAGPVAWIVQAGSPLLVVPNDVALLAVVAPLSVVLLYQESSWAVRVVAACSLFLGLVVVCVMQSRVALVTLIASLAFISALVQPRLGLVCGFASLTVAACIDGLLGFSLTAKFAHLWDTRIAMWLVAWKMFLDAPVFGHGPHTYGLFYTPYLLTLHVPDWLPLDVRGVPWAHNLYLEMLAEQGVLGFISFSFLLACGLATAWKVWSLASGDTRIFMAGALAGLSGFCIAATVELSLLRQWVVVVLFTFLGVIAQLSSFHARMREVG